MGTNENTQIGICYINSTGKLIVINCEGTSPEMFGAFFAIYATETEVKILYLEAGTTEKRCLTLSHHDQLLYFTFANQAVLERAIGQGRFDGFVQIPFWQLKSKLDGCKSSIQMQ